MSEAPQHAPRSKAEWVAERVQELCAGISEAAPGMYRQGINAHMIRDWADELKEIADKCFSEWGER